MSVSGAPEKPPGPDGEPAGARSPAGRGRLRAWSRKLALLLASTAFTLLALEAGLRLFYPKFKYAAESDYQASQARIWSRNPNSRYTRPHPDTGRPHLVRHNHLALRQHRDFPPAALEGATNVGVFGDSFVENLRLPAPYSFTEPLDYLLNLGGARWNVLNFGVDGYGTDQAYLAWRDFPARKQLRHVFYFFGANDIRNNYENRLFHLAGDTLVRAPARASPWFVRALAKFHLTYLVIEGIETTFYRTRDFNKQIELGAFLAHAGEFHSPAADRLERDFLTHAPSPELDAQLRLLTALLATWRREVEAEGGQFHIVLLPRPGEHRAAPLFTAAGHSVVDLYAYAAEAEAGVRNRPLVFARDAHWNELGNLIAAKKLYAVLCDFRGVSPLRGEALERALNRYYSAFAPGWHPEGTSSSPAELSGETAANRKKYLGSE